MHTTKEYEERLKSLGKDLLNDIKDIGLKLAPNGELVTSFKISNCISMWGGMDVVDVTKIDLNEGCLICKIYGDKEDEYYYEANDIDTLIQILEQLNKISTGNN